MPELPEVETTRRHLEADVVGARIGPIDVRRARMVRRHQQPGDFAARLTGRRVERLDRIGKFLMGRVEGDLLWVTHLGMSGRLQLAVASAPEAAHTNVVIDLEDGPQIRFIDPRTFGFMAAFTPDEVDRSSLATLGPDALDDLPSVVRFEQLLAGRSAPIKALLLDQRFLAGLGNIYADEVLFRSEIDPRRSGGSLDRAEISAIRQSIGVVLDAGIAAGGTSLDDMAYLLPDGRSGDFMARLWVYGRGGLPCRRCETPIERVVLGGRGTHWCSRCQH